MDYVPPKIEIIYSSYQSKDIKMMQNSINKYKSVISPLIRDLDNIIEMARKEKCDEETFKMIERVMILKKDLVKFFKIDAVENTVF